MYNPTEESVLDDEVVLTEASTGKRFANYIIDLLCFYFFMFVLGVLIVLVFGENALEYEESSSAKLLEYLISFAIYCSFYGLIESSCKGKTLGKLITNTRAVKLDGTPVDLALAFKRGLIRLIPFNAFSALGSPCNPWHDRWSDTLVIDEKQSTVPTKPNN